LRFAATDRLPSARPFATGPRVPSAFGLAGKFTLAAKAKVACGDDVTLSFGSVWSQTISGRKFVTLAGQCVYLRKSSSEGLIVSFTFDPRRSTWSVIGLGAKGALPTLPSTLDVVLRIGDDAGSARIRIGRQ
jgi:hypothetical protein